MNTIDPGNVEQESLHSRIVNISDKAHEVCVVLDAIVGSKPSGQKDPKEPGTTLEIMRHSLIELDRRVQYILDQVVAVQGLL